MDTPALPETALGVAHPSLGATHTASRARIVRIAESLRAWLRDTNGTACAVVVALFALYALWLFFGPQGPNHNLIANIANIPLDVAAGISALLTARRQALSPRVRRAWAYCALAFFADASGNAMWFVIESILKQSPSPSWADAGYLAYYPLMLFGLLLFPRQRRTLQAGQGQESAKLWLDIGIVMVGGFAVVWYVLLAPALDAPHANVLDAILSVAYPLGDLVLLFGSVFALMHRSTSQTRTPIVLLACGALALLTADVAYGYAELRFGGYESGSWIDIFFQLSGALWFLAAQYQRWRVDRPVQETKVRVEAAADVSVLPYFAIPIGYAVLFQVVHPVWSRTLGGVIIAVALLTALVVVRQYTAVQENRRLIADRVAREARFRSLVQHSSDVITLIDENERIQFVSPSVERIFGWTPQELDGLEFRGLIHPDDADAVASFLSRARRNAGASTVAVWRLHHAAGDWRHVEVVGTCLFHDPAVGGIVMNTRDVSERTALEKELMHQAYHDPLTGLANRARFRSQVERAITQGGRDPASVAVMFLDLDGFKRVNDSMGHAEGDRLLCEVARRLLKATRGSDVVARLGGDEFAVLLEKVHTDEQAEIIGERIIAGMRSPFALEGGEVSPTASIGIARGHAGQGVTELLRNADVAMYVAKRHRAGRYMIFEPEMHAEVRDRISLEGDLRRALDEDQLTLAYQPIFHLASGRIRGVEALVRWEHPTRGPLSPAAFIDVAEESGLIVPLGRVVLAKACRDMAGWSRYLDDDTRFTLAVNISGKQLHATLPNDVAEVLGNTGVAPSSLLLEITEGVVMRDTEATLQRLRALKALGVRLAIDDFGTGYSSLAYLQRFPIDVLKIDKSFVNHLGAGNGVQGASIAKTIVALGGALSLATVAEGVEREDQVEVLRALGCDFVQGYHFSRPVSVAQITAMLAADRNAHAGQAQGQAA